MLLILPEGAQRVVIEEMDLVINPGDIVDIPDSYCLPRKGIAGGEMPSVIDDLAGKGKLRPYVPSENMQIEVPLRPRQGLKARVVKRSTAGLPPAIADLVAAGLADDPRGPNE